MKPRLRSLCGIFTALMLTGYFSPAAMAAAGTLPTIKDHWHFFCTSKPLSTALIASLKDKVSKSTDESVESAITIMNYACLLHMYELQVFKKKVDKFEEDGGKGPQPQLSNKLSNEQLNRANSILSRSYKTSSDKAKGLYYYGYVLALLGDSLAVNIWDDLMTKFPQSSFTGDAYLALGEFYFDNKALDKAIREYTRALEHDKKPTKVYTKYKLAWAHYLLAKQANNPKDKEKAIGEFVALPDEMKSLDAYRKKLLSDSVKDDIVEILADAGDQENAKRILNKLGHKDIYSSLIERMAIKKLQAGDANGAYKLFGSILKERPDGPENPKITAYMVEIVAQKNNLPLLLKNMKFIEASFLDKKSKWRSKQTEAVLKKTDADAEKLFYDYATGLHKQGADSNNAQLMNAASQIYGQYLKNFPDSKRNYDVQFLNGQLLFGLKKYLPAASGLLSMLKTNSKGKYTKDGAEIMVTSAQYAIETDKTKYQIPAPGTAKTPIKLPQIKQVYVDSLDMFTKLFPKHENTAAMKYTAATVYFDFGQYEEAKKRFKEYLQLYPKGEYTKEIIEKAKKMAPNLPASPSKPKEGEVEKKAPAADEEDSDVKETKKPAKKKKTPPPEDDDSEEKEVKKPAKKKKTPPPDEDSNE